MAKKEKVEEKANITDPEELAKQIEAIGKQLDNPPVNLDRANYVTGTLSFGSLCLDVITGGGLPPGKITDIFGAEGSGKSTAVGHVMASAVKENIATLYYDHEASADAKYLGAQGVKIRLANGKKNPLFHYFQPTTGESTYRHINRVLDILPDYTNNDEGRPLPSVIFIIDSIAAMMPESQQDDDESNQMAASARAHSYGLRMIKSKLGRKNCSLLVTNQQREKPGVSYGCLHGETSVPFVDGNFHTIRDIVNKHIEGEVWSYNEKEDKLEPKKIVGWHNNGKIEKREDWVSFKTKTIDTTNGVTGFTVTKNHKIFTKRGWLKAEELKINDELLTMYKSFINGTVGEFIYGTVIGDGSLVIKPGASNSAHLRFVDTTNSEYVAWKINKLSNIFKFKKWKGETWASSSSYNLAEIKKVIKYRNPVSIFDNLTILSLAIHYMDDGNYDNNGGHRRANVSFKRFKPNIDILQKIKELYKKHGFNVGFNEKAGNINFTVEESDKFFIAIRKYIPDCMQYKLPEKHRGFYEEFDLENIVIVEKKWISITEISTGSFRKYRMKDKYDISVQDNLNYLVGNPSNGVIVHNSPFYQPGGNALKYYPDLMIRFSAVGKDWLERNRQFKKMNVKTMKNKQFVPFLELEEKIALCFGKGFERGYDGLGYLEITNQISKKAAWYTINTPTYEALNGQKCQHDSLMQICCSNEFRKFARDQINSGEAFKLYFQSMDWEKMYSVDEEDSGVDLEKLMKEESSEEDVNEVNLV